MEQEADTQKSQVKKITQEPAFIFWLGMVFGMIITAGVFGHDVVPKSMLKKKSFYMDGKYYEIKELK
jgi:hypothetical protein